jgi:hypothetical protein
MKKITITLLLFTILLMGSVSSIVFEDSQGTYTQDGSDIPVIREITEDVKVDNSQPKIKTTEIQDNFQASFSAQSSSEDYRYQTHVNDPTMVSTSANQKFDINKNSGGDTYCIDDRWDENVTGKTLVIIGTEDNNNAYGCMPFVSGDLYRDGMFMQPNVWDNKEYAVVLNTDEAFVVDYLSEIVKTDEIDNMRSHSAYLVDVGTEYIAYAAMGIGAGVMVVGSGGVATPAVVGTVVLFSEIAADGSDVFNSCYMNSQGGMCKTTIAIAVGTPVVIKGAGKIIKGSSGVVKNSGILDDAESLKNFGKYNSITGEIEEFGRLHNNFAAKTLVSHNPVLINEGTSTLTRLLGDVDNNIVDSFIESSIKARGKKATLSIIESVGSLSKSGKYSDEVIKDTFSVSSNLKRNADMTVSYKDTVSNVAEVLNNVPNLRDDVLLVSKVKGFDENMKVLVSNRYKNSFQFEVKATAGMIRKGVNIKAVSQTLKNPAMPRTNLAEIDAVGDDALYDFKDWNWDNPDNLGDKVIGKLSEQYDRYNLYMKANSLESHKRVLVFSSEPPIDFKNKIKLETGWEVKVLDDF